MRYKLEKHRFKIKKSIIKNLSFILIALIVSCTVPNTDAIENEMLDDRIRHLLSCFIVSNDILDIEKNDIFVICNKFDSSELIMVVLSDMKGEICSSNDYDDLEIYYFNYKGFRVFFIDNNCNVNYFSTMNINKSKLSEFCNAEFIACTYNGPYWELKIIDEVVVDFQFKYCSPNNEVIEEIKKIRIPQMSHVPVLQRTSE